MGRVAGGNVDRACVARVEREALAAVRARAEEAQARVAAAHPDASVDELVDALRRDQFFRALSVLDPLLLRIANAIASGRGEPAGR